MDIISSDRCQKVKLKKKWPFSMRSFLWLSLVDSYGPIILGDNFLGSFTRFETLTSSQNNADFLIGSSSLTDDPIGWANYQISINLKLPNNQKKRYKVYFLTPYTYHYNVISKLWIEHFITIYSFSDFELPATISPFNMFYRFQKKKKKRIARYVLYSRLERVDPFFRKLNRNPHGSKLTKQ